jgi:hypothetical protein
MNLTQMVGEYRDASEGVSKCSISETSKTQFFRSFLTVLMNLPILFGRGPVGGIVKGSFTMIEPIL